MSPSLIFPQTIDLFPGSFVAALHVDGAVEIIPHVATIDVDPSKPDLPVAATLRGPKVLDGWRARIGDCADQDVIHCLFIPDEPGLPWGSREAAYKFGCTFFDGRDFNHFDRGDQALDCCRRFTRIWRKKRGLPPATDCRVGFNRV